MRGAPTLPARGARVTSMDAIDVALRHMRRNLNRTSGAPLDELVEAMQVLRDLRLVIEDMAPPVPASSPRRARGE